MNRRKRVPEKAVCRLRRGCLADEREGGDHGDICRSIDALSSLQKTLDSFRSSSWLASGPSGGGSYPPMNVFRKGDDFVVIAEVPGIGKSDLEIQVKGNTIRLAGTKSVRTPRRQACIGGNGWQAGSTGSLSLPVEINADGVKAECHDGILALFLPRAERDKPKSIQVA